MKRAVLVVLAALPLAAGAEAKMPTEDQCRRMVDQMVQIMRDKPPPGQRDKDADALLARVEKTVKDNRASKKSECESWAYIGNAVTGNKQ